MSELVVKTRWGRDVRCLAVVNEDQTYEDFVMMLVRLYPALSPSADIKLKYQDQGLSG
jgi:hypothetical protein